MAESGLSQSVEDYLKAVYRLGKPGRAVGTTELAEELSVAPASVTGMLKRLSKDGYIDYTPRQGAELTAKGLEVALEIIRHHRLLESFFVKRLGMDWDQAHREAEVLEHYISEELENIIDQVMGHPDADPQGLPIPTREGEVRQQPWPSLAEMQAGQHCTVRHVQHPERELLGHIESLGLLPGTKVKVCEVGPFEGPIELLVGDRTLHLGHKVAAAIHVEPVAEAAGQKRSRPRSSSAGRDDPKG